MSDVSLTNKSCPLRRLRGVRVRSIGAYVPERVVRNEDLAALGYDAEWIVQRTGILERRYAPPEMATSDMATLAARQCIERADVDPGQIDLVVLGTFTPDRPVPATACLVQDRLGLNCPAMDVQAACAGFAYSLITGMQYVKTGCSRLALVIGADMNSRICAPEDKKTYPLFGDGAGAVLLEAGSDEQGALAYTLGADGSGADLLCVPMGGSRMPTHEAGIRQNLHRLKMNGRPVFKWAIRQLTRSIYEVVEEAGVPLDQVDVFVFHQANYRIMQAAAEDMGIDQSKMIVNVTHYGNTSAASIPLALDQARERGMLRPGSTVLVSGFGAGLAWGTMLLRW